MPSDCCNNKEPQPVKSCCSSGSSAPSASEFRDFTDLSQPIKKSSSPDKPDCCSKEQKDTPTVSSCCSTNGKDWWLLGSLSIVLLAYIAHWTFHHNLNEIGSLGTFSHGIFEMMNKMWWGLAIGIFSVGLLHNVPRTFIQSILGKGGTFGGILRATGAGLLLDLCNHGILLVAIKLYERGASFGQMLAFLIASPWNSLSLTLILFSLIGWKYTLIFILGSAVIAIITGYLADKLVAKGKINVPQAKHENLTDFHFFKEAKKGLKSSKFGKSFWQGVVVNGFKDSRSILKWIFIGAIMAAAIRAFVSQENFQAWFSASISGVLLTLLAATVIEVCSEGSSPIAADLVTRAHAPGNGFTLLMAGAATDYTELLALRQATKSWKAAFILPLLTLPQVLAIAILLNQYA